MVYPWDYAQNIILFWSEYGSFIAVHKTQAECVRFYQEVVRPSRKQVGFPFHAVVLDEESFMLVADEFEKVGRILA